MARLLVGAMVRSGRNVPVAMALLMAMGCGGGGSSPSSPSGVPAPVIGERVLVGAGDIGQCGIPGAEATARLLDSIGGTVFTAGDDAYFQGSAQQFRDCYHPTWGRHKSRTHPAPGNHEYETPGAAGYFDYFGEVAAPGAPGFYGFTLGAWRVYSLNSNIDISTSSVQLTWLQRELQAVPSLCSMVIVHHPLFSSGPGGGEARMRDLWRVMYQQGVDVVVNGHDHVYERFAPQDPDGRSDPTRGIRQFTVGTGGADLYSFGSVRPNSEARGAGTWGVIRFSLLSTDYSWEFVPVAGGIFRDSGTGPCH